MSERVVGVVPEAGHEHGCWVGMCGEMAGDPESTELLVGLDELSTSAVTIPTVESAVEGTTREAAAERAEHEG